MTTQNTMFDKVLALSPVPANELGPKINAWGCIGIYGSLAVIYLWFGGMKFTSYEAKGLVGLVEPSPLIGWLYGFMSVQGFSIFLGLIELTIAALIAARFFSPKFSFFGGLLSCGLFFVTTTLMLSTPGVFESSVGFLGISVMPGQFLLKDIGLFAASLFVVGESLTMATSPVSAAMNTGESAQGAA